MNLNTWESLDKAIETAQRLEAAKSPAKTNSGNPAAWRLFFEALQRRWYREALEITNQGH